MQERLCICNRCKYKKFYVIEPKIQLDEDHIYFSCSQCVYEMNRDKEIIYQRKLNQIEWEQNIVKEE